jgi:hypothetical protein
MWIFLSDSFLSIVDKGGDGSTLLVRSRIAGDIERVFPQAKVIEGGGTDYRFRARIDRDEVALRMAEAVRSINYPNFKSTVRDPQRHDALMGVWRIMYRQQKRTR